MNITKRIEPMRASLTLLLLASLPLFSNAQPDPNWLGHDRSRPLPPVVDPGSCGTQESVGTPPSDAVVLFNGTDTSKWVSLDGKPTKWISRNGYMECVQGSGYVRTLRNFGDCQLHVEFATPVPAEGTGQGRGNSGVFLGLDRYEIQVLDSYGNRTYADGSAGSIYGQYPPLVNASRPPGQWQTYDILYTAPRFDQGGDLLSPVRLTVFHNGVLIQNNVEVVGPTAWLGRPLYSAHPVKMPISLQDHGNPVRYRNIWVRELGKAGKTELTLPDRLLDGYVGTYKEGNDPSVKISREGSQLVMDFGGVRFLLFAETETKFFAKTTDIQCEFKTENGKKVMIFSVGEGERRAEKTR